MQHKDIASLVRRYKAGEEEAFTELYEQLWSSCYYSACKHLGDAEEAKDIVQEAFLKAKDNLSQLKDDMAFVSWMNRIVLNKCRDSLRRQGRCSEVTIEDYKDHLIEERREFLPDSLLQDQELCQTIASLVQTLPEEQKAAILLYYYNQMSTAEVAQTMEITPNAVKLRLSRARANIKKNVIALAKQSGMPLYSVAGIPVLTQILQTEAGQICTPEIKLEIWGRITAALATGGAAATASAAKSPPPHSATTSVAVKATASIGLVVAMGLAGLAVWKNLPQTNIPLPTTQAVSATSPAATTTTAPVTVTPTPAEAVKVLEDIVSTEDGALLRSWNTSSSTNHHEAFLALIEQYDFEYVSMRINVDGDGGMFVLYSLDKQDKKLLLCEYYSVGQETWRAVWSIQEKAAPVPEAADLETWFWQEAG